jgi:type III secretory pathway component EscS
MLHAATHLMVTAMHVVLLLALPIVAAVAATGVVVGMIQTIFQVQDQNVSFLPKLLVVATLVTIAGVPALALLEALFATAVMESLHLLGRGGL